MKGKCCICNKEGGDSYTGGPFPYLHKKCKDYANNAIVWHAKYMAVIWSLRPWVGTKKKKERGKS